MSETAIIADQLYFTCVDGYSDWSESYTDTTAPLSLLAPTGISDAHPLKVNYFCITCGQDDFIKLHLQGCISWQLEKSLPV